MTLRRAARAVQSGDARVVACIAGDTNHVDSFRAMLTTFSRFSQDAAYPYGSGGPNGSFSLMTSHYMRTYGMRREDFGKLCVAQRENALRFPHALMRKPLTLEEYLVDYATPETREAGEKLIAEELAKLPDGDTKDVLLKRITGIRENGEHDLYF